MIARGSDATGPGGRPERTRPSSGLRGAAGSGRGRGRAARGARAGSWFEWGSPQLLLAGLGLVLALVYAATAGGPRVGPPPALPGGDATPVARQLEVRYVVVDALGLERPGFADIELPPGADDASARLTAALGALRDDLVGMGAWPEAIGAPVGFVVDLDRRRLAVVDVEPAPPGVTLDVGSELTAVRSLFATARAAAAADDVRITVGGEERPSLWGKVAPPRG